MEIGSSPLGDFLLHVYFSFSSFISRLVSLRSVYELDCRAFLEFMQNLRGKRHDALPDTTADCIYVHVRCVEVLVNRQQKNYFIEGNI